MAKSGTTPSQARSASIASAYSARERSTSVSSKRRMKRPRSRSANSQLSKAVRALPMWMRPVGEGAKRTVGGADMRLHRSVARARQYRHSFDSRRAGRGSEMTISALAAGVAASGLALQTFSAGLAAFRCRRGRSRLAAPAGAPPVSLVQPLCGVEAFSQGNARLDIRARLSRLRNPVLPRRPRRPDRAAGAPRHRRATRTSRRAC